MVGMENKLASEFRLGSLLKFSMPTTIMMLFISLYTMVDGIFVSRYVGTDALSAINIVLPISTFVVGVGMMFGVGGSAVVATKLGEGKEREANQAFTLIVSAAVVFSILSAVLFFLIREPLLKLLGSDETLLPYCEEYLYPLLVGMPCLTLQVCFESFFVTAGKPKLGMAVIACAGVTNIVLDWLFLGVFHMGLIGASIATSIGFTVTAVSGLIFFAKKNHAVHFVKPKWMGRALARAVTNGSSEMVTNIATAVISALLNVTMMKLLGKDGVAAITIVLYGQFLSTALYLGYSGGVAPVTSYNYGARNRRRLRRLFKINLSFILISSVVITAASLLTAKWVVGIFAPRESAAYSLALHGIMIFSINYLFAGLNIYASSHFTAYSNGLISAIISFTRTFVLILICLLTLPALIGVDGVWLAVPIAEGACSILSAALLFAYRKKYFYGGKAAPNDDCDEKTDASSSQSPCGAPSEPAQPDAQNAEPKSDD